jgi:hypothetical protein
VRFIEMASERGGSDARFSGDQSCGPLMRAARASVGLVGCQYSEETAVGSFRIPVWRPHSMETGAILWRTSLSVISCASLMLAVLPLRG